MKSPVTFPLTILFFLATCLLPTARVHADPSPNSITSCTILEGGVDKGSNHTITFTPGVVQGSQALISITANDPSKSVGFEQGYVLKTALTGTLNPPGQSINVFSVATFTDFDLTWYVDSQKFNESNTLYPATTHGFQYRLFAVEGSAPYSYDSLATPLCTLTYVTATDDGGGGDDGGISLDMDLSHYFTKAESSLPDTL
jgi:hypothetical protein